MTILHSHVIRLYLSGTIFIQTLQFRKRACLFSFLMAVQCALGFFIPAEPP